MALESTEEPRKIRMRNVSRLFYEWHDEPVEARGCRALMAGYSPEFAGNLSALCREFFTGNRAFTIVLSPDDLCAKCIGQIREAKCALSYVRRKIGETEILPEKFRDNVMLATQKKRLVGLEATYEKLSRRRI
ncbi:MAG: hypothetical protein QME12_03555 [Nanoarchaeota archaeon]|nr:hypothetical protein [Nanoarchaeota archaeon]